MNMAELAIVLQSFLGKPGGDARRQKAAKADRLLKQYVSTGDEKRLAQLYRELAREDLRIAAWAILSLAAFAALLCGVLLQMPVLFLSSAAALVILFFIAVALH